MQNTQIKIIFQNMPKKKVEHKNKNHCQKHANIQNTKIKFIFKNMQNKQNIKNFKKIQNMPKKTHTHKNKSNFQNMQNKIEHTNKNHF